MKTFLIALLLGLMGSATVAQTTEVKIGRHGACNSGRGICGIQTPSNAKSSANNNAAFLKDANGNVILRLYKVKLSQAQIELLFGKQINPDSTNETLLIEQAFVLDTNTKSSLFQATGSLIHHVSATSFQAQLSEDFIDVILLKSKS